MISGDFFCNSPRPSCRISGASIVPPYPAGSVIPAAPVETICHRFASPCIQFDRLDSPPLPVRRSASRTAGRDDWAALVPIYSRNGEIPICRFPPRLSPHLIASSLRPPGRFPPSAPFARVEKRGGGRFRAFVSVLWIARFIYMICLRPVIL